MTAFDANLNVTHIEVGVNEDNDRLSVHLVIGQALPFAEPGTDKPLIAPIGSFRFPLDKDSARAIAKQLGEEAEKLKDPSKLAVASTMQDAEREASALKGIVGGQ